MNNRQLFGALAIGALILAAAGTIGIGAYNAGVAQGIAEGGRLIAAPPGTQYVYVWPRPWVFGFFPFFPLFFFVLFFFFVMRALLWKARWHGRWRYRDDGVPPAFEEWHRRAHAGQSSATGTASTAPEANRAG